MLHNTTSEGVSKGITHHQVLGKGVDQRTGDVPGKSLEVAETVVLVEMSQKVRIQGEEVGEMRLVFELQDHVAGLC